MINESDIGKQLAIFRPGEAARRMPRWQFVLGKDGRCLAIITYSIPGQPWRHNLQRTMQTTLDHNLTQEIFDEVKKLPTAAPQDCLPNEVLWSDMAEKCNAITRDQATNTLCYTITVYDDKGVSARHFAMKEDSKVLRNSLLYRTVAPLMEPYETLLP